MNLRVALACDTFAAGPVEDCIFADSFESGTTSTWSSTTPPQESVGPDIVVLELFGVSNYTAAGGSACPPGYGDGTEDCRGYSVGTSACNVGTVPVDWCDGATGCRETTDAFHPLAPATVSDHPVVAQNMYRLLDGRFMQIGASFTQHSFLASNTPDSDCAWNNAGQTDTSCVQPPAGGDQLGVGCTNVSSAGLNGARPLGPRSQIGIASGDHPPVPAGGETRDDYDQRLVVVESHLDPAQNESALYWMEGHYAVRDDARAGNGFDNASYREVQVGGLPGLDVVLVGPTIREKPALFAWQDVDPGVEIVAVDKQSLLTGEEADVPLPPGTFYPDATVTERFYAARRVTPLVEAGLELGGLDHYEYVIYNLNSDTAADSFTIDFGGRVAIQNVGFYGIAHHSGEPFDTSDWTIQVDGPGGTITWTAVDMGADTNALRWGTAFTFWFDASADAVPQTHVLGTFADGASLTVPF